MSDAAIEAAMAPGERAAFANGWHAAGAEIERLRAKVESMRSELMAARGEIERLQAKAEQLSSALT